MKAAMYYGKHDLRVEEVSLREIKDNEVVVAVKYCGVCGTDVHIFNGDGGVFANEEPFAPGHEFSGVVEKVGANVTSVKVGDKVSVDPNDMCGECFFCKNGMAHFCKKPHGIGTTDNGGFAEKVIAPEKVVYKVPDSIDFIEAAMCEPMSCCIHGIDLCNIKTGDTVLVMGGGPIGMIMMQLAINAGASKVILSEPVESKRKLALELGAYKTIDPINENIDEVLSKACRNVDVVIECVGSIRTESDAIRLAGYGATVMFFGLASPEEKLMVKPDDIFKKELKITSSFINPYTFERAIEVLESKKVDVKSIITDIVKLDDINEVFTNPNYRKSGKVMIKIQ